MNTLHGKITLGVLALLLAAAGVFAFFWVHNAAPAEASAQPGFYSSVATSSSGTIGTTALTIFATSTPAVNTTDGSFCKSRKITVGANANVRLTFRDRETPSATVGYFIGGTATTSETFDSGLHGCGEWKAWASEDTEIYVVEDR